MEPKSYQYSRSYCLMLFSNLAVWVFLAIWLLNREITQVWTYLIIAAMILGIYRFYDIIYNYLIPLIRRKPALQLDDEKLFYRIKKRIIKWDDIKEIMPSQDGLSPLKLVLKSGKKLKIRTSEIKGDDNEIYQRILSYFSRGKQQDVSE